MIITLSNTRNLLNSFFIPFFQLEIISKYFKIINIVSVHLSNVLLLFTIQLIKAAKIDLELRLGPTPSEAGESRMDTLDKSQEHSIKESANRRHNSGLYVHLLRARNPQPIKPSSLKKRLKRQAKKDLVSNITCLNFRPCN